MGAKAVVVAKVAVVVGLLEAEARGAMLEI